MGLVSRVRCGSYCFYLVALQAQNNATVLTDRHWCGRVVAEQPVCSHPGSATTTTTTRVSAVPWARRWVDWCIIGVAYTGGIWGIRRTNHLILSHRGKLEAAAVYNHRHMVRGTLDFTSARKGPRIRAHFHMIRLVGYCI